MTVTKRRMGSSGIEVAPIALGGNVFGWTADETASFAILDAFVDGGGSMIDTADVYSSWVAGHRGGESEALIGRWLKRDPAKRDKVIIATKVGYDAGLAPETVEPACEASLRRLGTDSIDLYYQHKDDEGVPLSDSLGVFDMLVRQGKIRAIGLSNFTPKRLTSAMESARENGLIAPVALQPWYNLVERDRFEGPLRDVAAAEGLAVFPYFSLATGFLSGKYRSREDETASVRGGRAVGYLDDRGRKVLAVLEEVADETGSAMATVALAWLKAQPTVTAPIASATNLDQADQLIAAMTLELSDEQIERLRDASE